MKKKWQKLTALLLAVVFCAALAGCGDVPSSTPASSTAPSSTESQSESTAPAADSTSDEKAPEEYVGEITVWTWDEAGWQKTSDRFNKVYPNIKVNLLPVSTDDYAQKILTAVSSGMDLPDVLLGEMGYRGKILSMDIWEDLSAEPYNFDFSMMMDYTIPLITSPDGKFCGIEGGMSPTGLAYKADLAEKYLGTSDPDELQAMFPTWEAFIEKGKEVTAATNGEIYMLTSLREAWTFMYGQNALPVLDGTQLINMDKVYEEPLKRVQAVRDAGIADTISSWTPEWYASFADDTHIFYSCATWGVQSLLKTNDLDHAGRWRIMVPPEGGINTGGTMYGIWNGSQKKDLAWKYVEFVLLADESRAYAESQHSFRPFKTWYPDGFDFAAVSEPDEFMGGQVVEEVYYSQIVPTLQCHPVTEYDTQLDSSIKLALLEMQKDPDCTAEQAYEIFRKEVINMAPELTW